MDAVNINQLLSQLRAMAAQVDGLGKASATAPVPAQSGGESFSTVLSRAVGSVNDAQSKAGTAADAFAAGKGDLPTAMLSMARAQVEFRAATEVRNRLVQAYRDVMNMTM